MVLFNNDVDVACKFEMFKFEYIDNEFKLLNIVAEVACKIDRFNAEYVDKLFTLVIIELPVKEFIIFNNVVGVAFKLLIDNVE